MGGGADEGWGAVADVFRSNLERGLEVGAACAVFLGDRKVVDVWGGERDPKRGLRWEHDTLVNVFSTTKGVSSMAVAHAHSRGLFDYDDRVAQHWPEFAQNGKQDVTVRQLLSHQAGLPAIDQRIDMATLADPDRLADVIARQAPAWEPGTRHGYHGVSLGFYESELVRRVDPRSRTIGAYLRDEVATPLGLDFHVGLPDDVDRDRIALLQAPFYRLRMVANLDKMPRAFVAAMFNPRSLTARTYANPAALGKVLAYDTEPMRRIELPAANGIGTARAVARAYGEFARGGPALGLDPATLAALESPAPDPSGGLFDLVQQEPTRFSLGFCKPFPSFEFGSPRAYGTPGAGGSLGFADPETGIGFGYVMNRLGHHPFNDPRNQALRDAAQRCARQA